MRGRGLMLVAGMRMGQNQAKAQAQAQSQQQAAVEQAKQEGAAESYGCSTRSTSSGTGQGCHRRAAKTGRSAQIGRADRRRVFRCQEEAPWLIILKNLFLSGYHLSGVVHNIFYRDNSKSTDCIIYIYCPFVVTNLKE